MRTKKEILTNTLIEGYNAFDLKRDYEITSDVYFAINKYAKERAIAFLNWVWINNYTDDNDALELYDIFNNENQEKPRNKY